MSGASGAAAVAISAAALAQSVTAQQWDAISDRAVLGVCLVALVLFLTGVIA